MLRVHVVPASRIIRGLERGAVEDSDVVALPAPVGWLHGGRRGRHEGLQRELSSRGRPLNDTPACVGPLDDHVRDQSSHCAQTIHRNPPSPILRRA